MTVAGIRTISSKMTDKIDSLGKKRKYLRKDLEALEDVEVVHQQKHFRLRTETKGTCGKVFQAVGVALPPTVRQIKQVAPT